jgi:hypothetical protein
VQAFITASGYTLPVLRQAGFLQNPPPAGYDIAYDNYVVVDAQGIVRYTSQAYSHAPATGRFYDSELRAAIQSALPSALEARTWSTVKRLYR